jgi:hypothetical protein
MPENEVLKSVAADIANINKSIAQAEELISALREAGEPVSEQESALRTLRIRKEKWERMLQARGYSTTA